MDAIIRDWVGQTVYLTIKVGGLTGASRIKGKLVNVGKDGALLELPKGQTFVPTASILHISLEKKKD